MTRTGGALVEVAPGVHAWVQPDGSWWINNAGAALAERLVLNLHRLRADTTGEPLDLPAALADAVTYHGGPLRCAV